MDDRIAELGWPSLLQRYRSSLDRVAAAEISRRLERRIGWAARQVYGGGGLVEEDVRQELALHVLEHALRLRVPDAERWIPRMLVERALRATRQSVRHDARLSTVPIGDWLPAKGIQEHEPLEALIEGFRGLGVRDADLRLLYRHHVDGIPLEDLAAERGTTTAALAAVLARARRQLRRSRASSDNAVVTVGTRLTHAPAVTSRPVPRQLGISNAQVRRRGSLGRPRGRHQEEDMAMGSSTCS